MRQLITNIKQIYGILPPERTRLAGREMSRMKPAFSAWLLVEDGRFVAYGKMHDMHERDIRADKVYNARGGAVLPAWCDPHTHIVYAGSREGEFVDKIRGLSYAEIARRGGGILNSADFLNTYTEDELYKEAEQRVNEIMRKGTGCVEIKSGYGLNTADEIKMLHVIQRLKENMPARIVSTFLGVHAVARGMEQSRYVDLVIEEMLPEVGRERLADFIDVFCDDGFFTPEQTDRILEAGAKWGLRPKIHADELASSGGVEVGVSRGALSVDHLESMTSGEIDILKGDVI